MYSVQDSLNSFMRGQVNASAQKVSAKTPLTTKPQENKEHTIETGVKKSFHMARAMAKVIDRINMPEDQAYDEQTANDAPRVHGNYAEKAMARIKAKLSK